MRKNPLVNENIYHIVNRSIAKYQVFNNDTDYARFINILDLYRFSDFIHKYSNFQALSPSNQKIIIKSVRENNKKIVNMVGYCLMPTHIHLILKQLTNGGISKYMGKVLNSYSRYFNLKHNRKGPLWQGRFRNIKVDTDEQLLHLTRYVHLNPTSADLVKNPKKWKFSSYNEYLNEVRVKICDYQELLKIDLKEYKKFVLDRVDYQKKISKIKNLLDNL